MNDRINKTSICSIVFLDIIDYSKKSDADQIEVKNQFNVLINRSLKGVAQNDRIILDTGDGVAIALMGSPEDAMFVALTIRDGILKINTHSATPLCVRFGINLGPVRIVRDINGHPNIIGDGINVAQRIMSFAKANQILVSRSYYEITSRLTSELSEMFDFCGVKHDKHVREHEVYSVRSHKDDVTNASQPTISKDNRRLIGRLAIANNVNLKYVALALPVLIAFIVLIKATSSSSEPIITLVQPPSAIIPSVLAANIVKPVKANNESLFLTEIDKENWTIKEPNVVKLNKIERSRTKLIKARLVKKETNQKEIPTELVSTHTEIANNTTVIDKPKEISINPSATLNKVAELTFQKNKIKQKSGWKTFTNSVKQGRESNCTQAEVSMHQCAK